MDNPPDQVHILWGALVGGPGADDWHRDITKDYVYNEVAVDYNAAIVGACAGLYHFFGTEDMKSEENFPPPESSYKTPEEIREFVVKSAVGQEDHRATQVLISFTNETLLPPRYLNEARARYYFNISELFQYGQTVKDIKVDIQYDKMGSQPRSDSKIQYQIVQYNDEGDCYLEFLWEGYKYYGAMDVQFALVDETPNADYEFVLDPTNDYSREGQVTEKGLGKSLNECPTEYDKITLYADGKLVWGTPPENCPDPEWLVKDDEPSNPPVPTKKVSYGDVNCDGDVDVSDAVLLARFIAEDSEATIGEQGLLNADCLADNDLTPDDIVLILKYVAKMIPITTLGKK